MKRALIGLLAALSAALGTAAAQAKSCNGVSFPEQIASQAGALKLNGLGLRQATFLNINVYVGALYLPQASPDADAILAANAPKEIILHFVRDVGGSDLSNGWDEGFEKNAKSELGALKPRIDAFKAMTPDVSSGDQLSLLHKPGTGVLVAVNGKPRGSVAGDDFARALFAIWLGSRPPNAGLKAGLLGGACV